jgi:ribose transport system permease protein
MALRNNALYRFVTGYEQIPLLLALLIICAYLTFATGGLFLSVTNVLNVLRESSILLIAALGMTVALLGGQVDLSVGSLLAVVGFVSITAYNSTDSVALAVLAGISVGVVVGLTNGFIVTVLRINAIIATLGMLAVLRGIGYLTTNARAVQVQGPAFQYLGNGYIGPIPVPIIIAAVLLVVTYYLLNYTLYGRYLYAAGGNEDAARSAGLPVRKIYVGAFLIVAVAAAISGVITAARLNSFQPTIGLGFELEVIAAVILGGTRLILLDVNTFWQDVIRGSVIIIAVALDEYRKRAQAAKFQEESTKPEQRETEQQAAEKGS